MDQVVGSARRLVTGIGGAEQRDVKTASQEIKHEPENERPFLKPVGQSTEQQDDPDDDDNADGEFREVSASTWEIEPGRQPEMLGPRRLSPGGTVSCKSGAIGRPGIVLQASGTGGRLGLQRCVSMTVAAEPTLRELVRTDDVGPDLGDLRRAPRRGYRAFDRRSEHERAGRFHRDIPAPHSGRRGRSAAARRLLTDAGFEKEASARRSLRGDYCCGARCCWQNGSTPSG